VDSTGKPETFKSALLRLSAINYTPRRAPRLIELVRTHPSVFRRLEFIDAAVQGNPGAVKYRLPVFHIGRASVLVLLVLSLLFVVNRKALFPPADIHYEMGREYALDGKTDEAIAEFSESARISPQSEEPHFALGILYAEKGVMQKAISEFEKVLKINPRNGKAREKLKRLRAAAGVHDD
jgi:tetratricopeptide (TPR) repeat protein